MKLFREGTTGYMAAAATIFTVALLIRLVLFLYVSSQPIKLYTPDSFGYDQLALNILNHGTFSSQPQPPFEPDLKRTPGYPAMISAIYAITGHSPEMVVLVQVVIGALLCGIVLLAALALRLPRTAGLVAALLVAVEPVSIMTSSQLLTETLYTALLTVTVALLAIWRLNGRLAWLLLAALLLGLAALVRPIGQFLPIALAPVIVLVARRRGVGYSAIALLLFLAVSIVVTYSWAYQNFRVGGEWTLSTVSDINLVYYRAREVLASSDGLSQEEARIRLEQRVDRAAASMPRSDAERQQALAVFRDHPVATVAMLAKGAARIFVDPGLTTACTLLDKNNLSTECFSGEASMNETGISGKVIERLFSMTPLQLGVLAWSVLIALVMYLAALAGIASLVRERRWFPLSLLLVPVVYLVLLSAGAEAYSRFRIPIVPELALLGSLGIYSLFPRFHRGRAESMNPLVSAD